jgi:hypothetical protein
MAEPADDRTVSMRVSREFLLSRLENQLLTKVYELLVPAADGRCHVPFSSAGRVRSHRLSGITSHAKGV